MEGLIFFLILLAVYLLVVPLVAMAKAAGARREAEQTRNQLAQAMQRLKLLELEVRQLQGDATLRPGRAAEEPVVVPPIAVVEKPVPAEPVPPEDQEAELDSVLERILREEARISAAERALRPPPLPSRDPVPRSVEPATAKAPAAPPSVPVTPKEPEEPFSLERFMGVKLFAWLGGVAMFFGMSFFVKYAFDNNLIPPWMRIALGFVTGAALLGGGLFTHRLPRYRVLAQAFCATGVLVLYGVSFAAHAIYHFPLFGTVQTFVLMAVITFAAFLIAVRLDALVVAVLGMLGGFMTPLLLSTGQDQPLGLFGYIALLDIGLLAVSRHGRWRYLTSCAAVGTVLMQVGWCLQFFDSGHYASGQRILVPMGILIGFVALFLAGGWIGRRKPDLNAVGSVLGLSAVAMVFAFVMLAYGQVAARHFLLYGFVLLIDLAVIAAVLRHPRLAGAQVVAAVIAFVHLANWSQSCLTAENLTAALAIYLVFGALHAVLPVFPPRVREDEAPAVPLKAGPWLGSAVLLLVLLPILNLSPLPMVVWAAVLMADLLVIALAIASGTILPVLATLVLTMGLAGLWLTQVPSGEDPLLAFLSVITGFSAVFTVAGKWLARRWAADDSPDRGLAVLVPVVSGLLPFLLLILAIVRLPVANPSPVFTVALAMAALLAWLALGGKQGPLVLAALGGTLAVEGVWHASHFNAASPVIALTWYLGFYAAFVALPFVFRKACAGLASPWIASALSGVGHFLLVHDVVKRAFPNEAMGLVPAAFALPALASVWGALRLFPGMDESQRSRLAWFGGVALLFITLIFPIQFERQWLTVSWAIEGALLLWLFRKVPHPGLPITALVLLGIAFLRLTVNPFTFTSYPRSGTAIVNWYLYTYGLVAAAQFVAARWFTDPDGRLAELHAREVLNAMGGVLLFALLNIEIADYFTAPGSRFVAFEFGGNFARDMTYSIAWGLFSLGLLGIGFRLGSRYARFAAVALLVLTLVKLFLHDLAAIGNIFRIAALIGVAVIAFVASFLYQRFFDRAKP